MPDEPILPGNAPVNILIAEDSPTQAQRLRHILEKQGYTVARAENGRLALDAVLRSKPTLIISDVVMPEMDGYEFCRRVKANPAIRDIPVILVTTMSDPQEVIHGLECGADNFILKPYDEAFLLNRLQFVLLNLELHQSEQAEEGVEIIFNEQRHVITSSRRQILNLLISTYEAAIARNGELTNTQTELRRVNSEIRMGKKLLELEQEKSKHLMLNILPQPIADRLMKGETVIAERFSDVTILFADIVNFTSLSSHTDPVDLVDILNDIFSRFDRLTDVYGLEKIKTIGDCYMVVGGLPIPRADHAEAVAGMALDMLGEIYDINHERGINLGVRIGLNSGPVVAGVIGSKKFTYDLWGHTVNVASRMESSGMADRIQVAGNTQQLLADKFILTERGTVECKGLGDVPAYFLNGKK